MTHTVMETRGTRTGHVSLFDPGVRAGDRAGVARTMAGDPALAADEGALPLLLHDVLLGRPPGTTPAFGRTERFRAAGRDFWWLTPSDASGDLDEQVGLSGHRIARPDEALRSGIVSALEHIASRPWALELVTTYVTTFALAETRDPGGRRLLTSCSLPDFPLCVFLSPRVFVHIPPVSIHPEPSARLAAENLYHEAVHQAVNHQLLVHGIMTPDYSSDTSPKIPIYWRRTASEDRNRAWEIDRVLHAAAVYCHLLQWRYHELTDPSLTEAERTTVAAASAESVGALDSLCQALAENIVHFTSEGALFVGRLVAAAEIRSQVMSSLLATYAGTRALES
ncbi:hypothetical protein ACTMTU_20110 [Streptomyces sp. OZ13]|uniref:hypothetical protein n=1 Tax=Streptomyces sp. OZ13 TaxID=3452210 RepID=UPI003F8A4EF4